jgi:hypothetical protein
MGALAEFGLPLLEDKLTQDTKLDLVKRSGISASMESLGSMFGIETDKYHMTQTKWRSANRLTPEGIAHTKKRVTYDVQMHIEMRRHLLDMGMLRAPSIWSGKIV